MDLRAYLDRLPHGRTLEFSGRLGISEVYLYQLASRQRTAGPALAVSIERESEAFGKELSLPPGTRVTRDCLRPHDYWTIWPDLPKPATPTTERKADAPAASNERRQIERRCPPPSPDAPPPAFGDRRQSDRRKER